MQSIDNDNCTDFKTINGLEAEHVLEMANVTPCTNFCFNFPALESFMPLTYMSKLHGIVDLIKVIVITASALVLPTVSVSYQAQLLSNSYPFTAH